MTNLNDTGESIPAYHIDRTLYEGRPADTSGREDKEIRTYDLLDSLQVPFVRVDHDALPTIEACREVDQLLGTDFYLLLMPGNKKFKTAVLSKQIGSARLSFGEAEFMESFLNITPGSVSVMGLMNDREKRVRLLIDKDILEGEYFACHPCINTSSLKFTTRDLMDKILPALGHPHTIVDLPYAE